VVIILSTTHPSTLFPFYSCSSLIILPLLHLRTPYQLLEIISTLMSLSIIFFRYLTYNLTISVSEAPKSISAFTYFFVICIITLAFVFFWLFSFSSNSIILDSFSSIFLSISFIFYSNSSFVSITICVFFSLLF